MPPAFSCPETRQLYDRFADRFGPCPSEGPAFSRHVRSIVAGYMTPAVHETSKCRDIRKHFLRSFHPDTGTIFLNDQEKCAVFVAGEDIFAPVEVHYGGQ